MGGGAQDAGRRGTLLRADERDFRLLTYQEAARLLRVRWEAVRELVETDQLRSVRVGNRRLIPVGALEELHRPPVVHPSGAP